MWQYRCQRQGQKQRISAQVTAVILCTSPCWWGGRSWAPSRHRQLCIVWEVLPLQLLEPEPGDHARGPSSWKFRGWTPYNIAWPGCESWSGSMGLLTSPARWQWLLPSCYLSAQPSAPRTPSAGIAQRLLSKPPSPPKAKQWGLTTTKHHMILLMEEILHQLISNLSPHLLRLVLSRCKISSIYSGIPVLSACFTDFQYDL